MKPLNYSDAPTGDTQRDGEARAWRKMCDEMNAERRAEGERRRLAHEAWVATWPPVFFAGICAPE